MYDTVEARNERWEDFVSEEVVDKAYELEQQVKDLLHSAATMSVTDFLEGDVDLDAWPTSLQDQDRVDAAMIACEQAHDAALEAAVETQEEWWLLVNDSFMEGALARGYEFDDDYAASDCRCDYTFWDKSAREAANEPDLVAVRIEGPCIKPNPCWFPS
jgi:hypothetical protein